MTTIYFNYAFITQLRYIRQPDSIKDSSCPFRSWKWLSSLFMTAILWETVICSVYWSILYPDDRARLEGKVGANIWNCLDHAFPFIFLCTDWCLNRIYFEANQVYANIFVFLIYGLVNLTYTFVKGEPVYPPISWDSVGSWILGLSMLPLALLYYFIIYYLTKCKFRCMKMHDSI